MPYITKCVRDEATKENGNQSTAITGSSFLLLGSQADVDVRRGPVQHGRGARRPANHGEARRRVQVHGAVLRAAMGVWRCGGGWRCVEAVAGTCLGDWHGGSEHRRGSHRCWWCW